VDAYFVAPVLMSNRPNSLNHTLRLASVSSDAAIVEFRSVGIQVISVCLWEIAIKNSLGRSDIVFSAAQTILSGRLGVFSLFCCKPDADALGSSLVLAALTVEERADRSTAAPLWCQGLIAWFTLGGGGSQSHPHRSAPLRQRAAPGPVISAPPAMR
jgi:hypothetical protein